MLRDVPRRRTSLERVALGLAIALATIAGLLALWAHVLVRERWSRTERKVDAMIAREIAAAPTRAVLYGEAEPGDAWEEYRLALPKSWGGSGPEWWDCRAGGAAEDACPEIVAHVVRGAHRAQARLPFAADAAGARPPIVIVAVAAGVVDEEVGARLARQEDRRAAELALDLCQFGRDVLEADGGEDDGAFNVLDAGLGAIARILASGDIAAETAGRVADGLERLEADFPLLGASLRRLVARRAAALVRHPGPDFLDGDAAEAAMRPRYCWSCRVMIAGAIDRIAAGADRMDGLEFRSSIDATPNQRAVYGEVAASANPLCTPWWPGRGDPFRAEPWREARLRLRCLRQAAFHCATGQWLEFGDSMGKSIRHATVNGCSSVWSEGWCEVPSPWRRRSRAGRRGPGLLFVLRECRR